MSYGRYTRNFMKGKLQQKNEEYNKRKKMSSFVR